MRPQFGPAHLRAVRQARGLTPAEVARRLGHRNPHRGARRLMTIEATGIVNEEMLVRLAEALELDWADFEEVLAGLGWQGEPALHQRV
jgi:transcriptional regulator with XRE-family HTH domain